MFWFWQYLWCSRCFGVFDISLSRIFFLTCTAKDATPPHFLFVQQPSNHWAFPVKVFAVNVSMAAGPIILCFTSNNVRIGEFLQLNCNKVFKSSFVLKNLRTISWHFPLKHPEKVSRASCCDQPIYPFVFHLFSWQSVTPLSKLRCCNEVNFVLFIKSQPAAPVSSEILYRAAHLNWNPQSLIKLHNFIFPYCAQFARMLS